MGLWQSQCRTGEAGKTFQEIEEGLLNAGIAIRRHSPPGGKGPVTTMLVNGGWKFGDGPGGQHAAGDGPTIEESTAAAIRNARTAGWLSEDISK